METRTKILIAILICAIVSIFFIAVGLYNLSKTKIIIPIGVGLANESAENLTPFQGSNLTANFSVNISSGAGAVEILAGEAEPPQGSTTGSSLDVGIVDNPAGKAEPPQGSTTGSSLDVGIVDNPAGAAEPPQGGNRGSILY